MRRAVPLAVLLLGGCAARPDPPPPPPAPVPPVEGALETADRDRVGRAAALGATAHDAGGGTFEVRVERSADARAVLAALSGCGAVVGLGIESDALADADLGALAGLTGLERLTLVGCPRLTGTGFVALAGLPRLKVLAVAECPVGDAAPRALAGAAALEEVRLERTTVTDAGLKALPALEALALDGTPVAGRAFAEPGWAKLRALDAPGTALDDAGAAAVLALPALERLSADRTAVSDAGLVGVARAKKLADLSLVETRITDAGVRLVLQNEALRTLDVSGTRAAGDWFAGLPVRPNLRKLGAARTRFDDAAAGQLGRFPNLARIDLSGCEPLTDKGLVGLAAVPRLAACDLSDTGAGDLTAAALARLAGIEDVRMARSNLTDAGTKLLGAAPKLRHLDARGTKVTREGAERAKMGRARLEIRTD